jgi:hypothetical protein
MSSMPAFSQASEVSYSGGLSSGTGVVLSWF